MALTMGTEGDVPCRVRRRPAGAARCVDIQHSIRRDRVESIGAGRIHFVWGDARSWCPPAGVRFDFVAAFPPCTHLARSGGRDWQKKGHYLVTDALELWASCQTAASYAGAPYCIENPIGALSRHMCEPDFFFDPCDYAGYADDPQADAYTKKTCLWTGGGFVMPPLKRVEPAPGSRIYELPDTNGRDLVRSAEPIGFARAAFAANHKPRRAAA
jgi:hypothetical protein